MTEQRESRIEEAADQALAGLDLSDEHRRLVRARIREVLWHYGHERECETLWHSADLCSPHEPVVRDIIREERNKREAAFRQELIRRTEEGRYLGQDDGPKGLKTYVYCSFCSASVEVASKKILCDRCDRPPVKETQRGTVVGKALCAIGCHRWDCKRTGSFPNVSRTSVECSREGCVATLSTS